MGGDEYLHREHLGAVLVHRLVAHALCPDGVLELRRRDVSRVCRRFLGEAALGQHDDRGRAIVETVRRHGGGVRAVPLVHDARGVGRGVRLRHLTLQRRGRPLGDGVVVRVLAKLAFPSLVYRRPGRRREMGVVHLLLLHPVLLGLLVPLPLLQPHGFLLMVLVAGRQGQLHGSLW
jgi:hypothetical protein